MILFVIEWDNNCILLKFKIPSTLTAAGLRNRQQIVHLFVKSSSDDFDEASGDCNCLLKAIESMIGTNNGINCAI